MDLDIVAYKLKDDLWAFDYDPNGTIEELQVFLNLKGYLQEPKIPRS